MADADAKEEVAVEAAAEAPAAEPAPAPAAEDSKCDDGAGGDDAKAQEAPAAQGGAGAGAGAGAAPGHATLPADFFYSKASVAVPRMPLELPRDKAALDHAFGFAYDKLNNLVLLGESTIASASGSVVQLLDIDTMTTRYLFGKDGRGIGALSVSPDGQYFAVAEKGEGPNVYIYTWPELRLYRICRKGTEKTYTDLNFSHDGQRMVTVGAYPDFLLTVWDWKNERIILRSKAFSQNVYNARYSPISDGFLTTSGTNHIRFWRMASTFTGLKLQGEIGKFGKVELSDICAFAQMPDGKVLTGSENGSLLLWDGNFIKLEVAKLDKSLPHSANINALMIDPARGTFVSGADDGWMHWWDFEPIDQAETDDDNPKFFTDPAHSVKFRDGVKIRGFVRGPGWWVVQDSSGTLWRLDDNGTDPPSSEPVALCSGHSGAIASVDASPVDHFAATAGADGYVRCWDYVDHTELYSKTFNCPATALAWANTRVDPRGRVIAVGFDDGVVRVLLRGKEQFALLHVFKPHTKAVSVLSFSRDGEYLATGGEDGTVFLMAIADDGTQPDGKDYRPIGFVDLGKPVRSIDWNTRDDKLAVALGGDGGVVEVDMPDTPPNTAASFELRLETRTVVLKPPEPPLTAEERAAMAAAKKAEEEAAKKAAEEGGDARPETPLVNPFEAKRRELAPGATNAAVYSPVADVANSAVLMAVAGDGYNALHECEWENPRPTRSFPSSARLPTGVVKFSHSGKFLLTGCDDGSVWVRPRTLLRHYVRVQAHDGDSGQVRAVATSFDDKFLLSVGNDGQFFVFRLKPEELLAAAKAQDGATDPYSSIITKALPTLVAVAAPDPSALIDLPAEKDVIEDTAVALLTVADVGVGDAKPAPELAEAGVAPFEAVPSSQKTDEHDAAAEADLKQAEDITDAGAYSIQDAKLKTEEDNQRRAAELKKNKVREVVSQLQEEFAELRRRIEAEPDPARRLTEEELVIDKFMWQQLRDEGDKSCAEVERELAWITAKHRIAQEKIRARFLGKLAVERVRLHALRSNQSVCSFRTTHLPDYIQESLQEVRALLAVEQASAAARGAGLARGGQGESPTAAARASRLDGTETGAGGASKGHGWEFRKQMRLKRKAKLRELDEEGKRADEEDPADVAAVKDAKENMGDYKLKTDPDYKVPEEKRVDANKKRRQMVLLEESIFALKMDFNSRLLALRDLKKQIIVDVSTNNGRIREINKQLGVSEELWEPETDRAEYPELRDEVTEADRREAVTSHGEPMPAGGDAAIAPAADGAGDGAGAGAGAAGSSEEEAEKERKVASDKTSADVKAALALLPVLAENHQAETDGEASELEQQERWAYLRRLGVERNELLEAQAKRVGAFDDAVYELRRERLKLEADLKAAMLRLVLLYRELTLLRDLAKRDDALGAKLDKARADKAAVTAAVMECKAKLAEKRSEIEVWREKDTLILNEFYSLVGETHPASAALLKIFKRRIKRSRKNADGESESDEEDEDDWDDDDEDLDDDDEEEDACPPGCDQQLYDKVLELREKRLDQEEVLADFQKVLDDLTKSHDRHQQRERQIDKDLMGTEREIQSFQTEKQRLLNQFDVILTITLSQIMLGNKELSTEGKGEEEADADAKSEGEGDEDLEAKGEDDVVDARNLPPTIDDYLVFARESVNRLKSRIGELQHENRLLKRGFKDLGRQQRRLTKDEKRKEAIIAAQLAKCDDLQMLKFGQLIDLDSLDKMTASKSLEELEARIRVQEAANMTEVSRMKERVVKEQARLTQLTRENTELLEAIGQLTARQQRLEKELNAAGGVHVSDGGPAQRKEAEERARLLQLVKLQAKEMEALKAEIGMLRRKGGHVYTPAVPPPAPELVSPDGGMMADSKEAGDEYIG